MKTKHFYSHGKLLLTAEYVVLDNALALAVPTIFGQLLKVTQNNTNILSWDSVNAEGKSWFKADFYFKNNKITASVDNDISKNLIKIFEAIASLDSQFFKNNFGYNLVSTLEFPQNWGLGSSSTLINNMARWANIDAFKLSHLTFGGSGYDIACAQNSKPILYQTKNRNPKITPILFNPIFNSKLYFVHLNEKQNSRDGIAHYKAQQFNIEDTIVDINSITKTLSTTTNFSEFCKLLEQHESIISNITEQKTVKKRLFPDFNGTIKSLGAWGGDFVLVASNEDPTVYFKAKGFETILNWNDMILTN